MIHALDILKITGKIVVENNTKMTLPTNAYLLVSPFYKDEELIPVKISYNKSNMTHEEFKEQSYKNYFSNSSEVKIPRTILTKKSKVFIKFKLEMINLNCTSHLVFIAKQERKILNKIKLPAEITEKFNCIFDCYEKMLLTDN